MPLLRIALDTSPFLHFEADVVHVCQPGMYTVDAMQSRCLSDSPPLMIGSNSTLFCLIQLLNAETHTNALRVRVQQVAQTAHVPKAALTLHDAALMM